MMTEDHHNPERWPRRLTRFGVAIAVVVISGGVAAGLVGGDGSRICRQGMDHRPPEAPPLHQTGQPSDAAGIWLMDADGSNPKRLPTAAQPFWLMDRLQWLPGGDEVAYLAEGGTVVVKVNGTEAQPVEERLAVDAVFSADGRKIAFVDGGLPTINADGSTAFVDRGLATSNADGTDRRQLTTLDPSGLDAVTYPAWSPDGKRIVFSADSMPKSSVERLEMINADGSGRHVLIGKHGLRFQQSSWSPDGTEIAFSALGGYYGSWIGVVKPDGSGYRRIARHCSGTSPEWSPDGSMIVFNDQYSLIVMDADGSNMQRLPNTWDGYAPAWSPDGKKIAFLHG